MQRRTLIASLGTLFVAGCAGAPTTESPSTTSTSGDEATGNESMAGDTTDAPAPDFTFKSMGNGVLRVVHMGGENVTDAGTTELAVTVDDERAVTWVSDEDTETAGVYPVSIGNYVEVETSAGSEVAVVWVGQNGTEETLATHTVEA